MTVGAIRRPAAAVAAVAVAAALALVAGSPADAATPPVGSFPVWTQTGPTTFDGQLSAAAGGGTIAVTTTASNPRVAETGTSAFLGPQTGFGQTFGSSRYQSYLSLNLAPTVPPATHGADSVTTVTLATLPAGWGFAVGDIDADMVSIDAIGGGSGAGGALTAAELNPQDTTGTPILNYCANASPKPSGCGSGTTFTDHPWWCPDGNTGGVCAAATRSNTVVGNVLDTSGSYDWFVPTATVSQLTLSYQWLSGIPNFQLWIVVPVAATVVSGHVEQASGAPAPAGTALAVDHGDGSPVLDLLDAPLIVPVAADGSYSFTVETGSYQLVVQSPEGFEDSGSGTIGFTATGDTLSLPTLVLDPVLAETGTDPLPLLLLAGGLLVLGVVVSGVSLLFRRRRTH